MFWCVHAKKNLGEGRFHCTYKCGGVERGVVHVTGDCVGCPDKWPEDDVKKWTAGGSPPAASPLGEKADAPTK